MDSSAFQSYVTSEPAIDVRVFTDPTRVVYQEMGFTRGCFRTFLSGHCEVVSVMPRAKKGPGGDALQNGGALVMSSDGNILLHHTNKFTGDFVSMESILEAIDNAQSNTEAGLPAETP